MTAPPNGPVSIAMAPTPKPDAEPPADSPLAVTSPPADTSPDALASPEALASPSPSPGMSSGSPVSCALATPAFPRIRRSDAAAMIRDMERSYRPHARRQLFG